MERWITPILFAIASGVVRHYNGLYTDRQAVFPGLHLIPGYESMFDQGQLTWQLFAGVAAFTLVLAIVGQIRDIRRRRKMEEEELNRPR